MTPTGSLSMYDWPEVTAVVDRLWSGVVATLRELGVEPPPERSRPTDLVAHWLDPSLLLGQTCGLPLVQSLGDAVAVVGAFDHRLPDTGPGEYHSAIIVRSDDDAASIGDVSEATLALNGADSQSGHSAFRHFLHHAGNHGVIDRAVVSGGHRDSVQHVADGRADIAAIDAVSWELALRHEPAAQRCRVLARTEPTPGLPLITAAANEALVPHLRAAIAHSVAALSPTDRDELCTHALIARSRADYDVLAQRWAAADAADIPRFP